MQLHCVKEASESNRIKSLCIRTEQMCVCVTGMLLFRDKLQRLGA